MKRKGLFAVLPETQEEKPSTRNRLMILFSLILAAFFLYYALRNLDWASFWSILKHGDYKIALLVIPISSFNFFLRALRWRVLVKSQGDIPVLSVFWANMVGYLGNAYLPARAGEIIRSAFLGKQSGAGTSFVLATALTERILDAMALVLIGSASLVFQMNVNGVVLIAVRTMAIAASVGLLAIFLLPFYEDYFISLLRTFPISSSLREKIIQQFQRFLMGMRSLQNFRRFFLFALFTAAIWLIDGLGTLIGVKIIGQSLNLGQALIYLSALGLSSAIPSTPGYVGVYQFVSVTVLVPFGFTKPDALAYILISQILGYILITFWGLVGLTQIKVSTPPA